MALDEFRGPAYAVWQLEMGHGVSWDNFLRSFTECSECGHVMLKDPEVLDGHICPDENYVPPARPLGSLSTQADVACR